MRSMYGDIKHLVLDGKARTQNREEAEVILCSDELRYNSSRHDLKDDVPPMSSYDQ